MRIEFIGDVCGTIRTYRSCRNEGKKVYINDQYICELHDEREAASLCDNIKCQFDGKNFTQYGSNATYVRYSIRWWYGWKVDTRSSTFLGWFGI